MDAVQAPIVFTITLIVALGLFGFIGFQVGMIRSKNTTTLSLINVTAYMMGLLIYLTIGQKFMKFPSEAVSRVFMYFHGLFQVSVSPLATSSRVTVLLQALAVVSSLMMIAGATAERLKLWPYILFSIVFAGFIYPVPVYWFWGGGFLYQIGYIDVGGSSLIFLAGGIAGLIGSYRLGPRSQSQIRASNLPFVAIGGGLTAVALSLQSAIGIAHTHQNWIIEVISDGLQGSLISGAAGFLTTLVVTRIVTGLSDLSMAINGLFAGIAACAADPIHFSEHGGVTVGILAGLSCFIMVRKFERWNIDDPCGIAPSFVSGSILGVIAVMFVQQYDQLSAEFHRDWNWYQQLATQCAGLLIMVIWVSVLSYLLWWLLDALFGLRMNEMESDLGLDAVDCGMQAYPEFTHSGK